MIDDFNDDTDHGDAPSRQADRSALYAVSETFSDMHFTRPVSQIRTRGASVRRRRRALPALGVMAVAAAAATAALAPSGGSAAGTTAPTSADGAGSTSSRPGVAQVNVSLAAFSLSTASDGTVSVRIKEFGDAPELQQALNEAGVHAKVNEYRIPAHTDSACLLPRLTQAEQSQLDAATAYEGPTGAADSGSDPIVETIEPTAMPADATLVIDIFQYTGSTSWFSQMGMFDGPVPTGCAPHSGSLPLGG